MRAENLENHIRSNNVCIVGLPGKAEGRDPWDLWQRCLYSSFLIPTRPLLPGSPPKPMLACLLNYRDRETVNTHLARERSNIHCNEIRILFQLECLGEVQRSRAKFIKVRKQLHSTQCNFTLHLVARHIYLTRDNSNKYCTVTGHYVSSLVRSKDKADFIVK